MKLVRAILALDAQSFAVMGGLYAAVSCWTVRIRQKQDGAQM